MSKPYTAAVFSRIVLFGIIFGLVSFIGSPLSGQNDSTAEPIRKLKQMIRQADPPDGQIQSRIRQANSLERRGRYEEASKILRDLYEDHPNHGSVYRNYRDVLIKMNDFVTAEAVISRFLKNHPNDMNSLIVLGTVYYNREGKSKALRQWRSVLESLGKTPRNYQAVLNEMVQNGMYNEASDLASQAREEMNDPAFYAIQLASLFTSRMNYDRATEEYLHYYRHQGMNANFLVSRITRFPDESDVHEQVIPVLDSALETYPRDTSLVKVVADYHYRIRRFDRALKYYTTLEAMKDEPGKYRRSVARDFLNDEEYRRAINLYDQLLHTEAIDSNRAGLRFGYAEASYQHLLNTYRDSSTVPLFHQNAFWELPFIIIPENEQDRLGDIVEQYQALVREDSSRRIAQVAMYRLGEIYLHLGNDFDQALRYFRQCTAARNHPRFSSALIKTGYCHLARADVDAAREQWNRAVRKLPPNKSSIITRTEMLIAGTYFYSGDIPGGFNRIDSLVTSTEVKSELYNDVMDLRTFVRAGLESGNRSDSLSLREFFRGEFYLQQHKISQARKTLLRIPEKHPESSLAPYALARAAQLAGIRGLQQEAITQLTRITSDYPEVDIIDQVYYMLGDIHYSRDKYTKAMNWYEKILVDHPGSILNERARQTIRKLQQKTS